MEVVVRGTSITIVECRPPWTADLGTEWTRHDVAQLRYAGVHDRWTLYWADRNGRWNIFAAIESGPVSELLGEIELDSSGIFWG